jgi:hypothetical protein
VSVRDSDWQLKRYPGPMVRRDDPIVDAAFALDVFNLAYEYGTESMQWVSTEAAGYPRKGIGTRLLSFTYRWSRAALQALRTQQRQVPPESTLFVAVSANERHSCEPIASRVSRSALIGSPSSGRNGFPLASSYMLSLRFMPRLVRILFEASGYRRRSFAYNLDGYLLSYGMYVATRRWLREVRPAAVVSCNHLHVMHRTITKAAQDEGIPTAYLQHASVAAQMPPLDFDVALLEGEDAASKYSAAGSSTATVYLVGMAKSDAYVNLPKARDGVKVVGVCTNNLDSMDRARELCVAMRTAFPNTSLLLRPHPSDRRLVEWQRLAAVTGLEFSDAREVHPFRFLSSIDLLIAGDSNIHLEAALMDVLPIYHDFSGTAEDWYGFLRHGLVEYAKTPDQVCEIIRRESQSRSPVRQRAKRYCVTVGTKYQGRSAELAANVISSLGNKPASRATPDASVWRVASNAPLRIYEPR